MKRDQLAKIVDGAKCKVFGWDNAGNDGHRLVLATLIDVFNNSESALLCEPSLARKTNRPPDVVLIDPEIGVHVFEIKAMTLDQIESLEAGGQLRIRYANGVRSRNPIVQVRNAMFDIKDATVRAFGDDVRLPFTYWIVFPTISRSSWLARFGEEGFCPREFLFCDDLNASHLGRRLGASDRSNAGTPIPLCPLNQLQCVWKAFGDTSVLYASPEERHQRRAGQGTLGEQFDEDAEAFKSLSEDQQRLSAMNWENGPRLVRGVAGSGKTVVLANNIARRLERMLIAGAEGLFGPQAGPKLLAVCYNRTLAPFIAKKINTAFQQRTGRLVPESMIEVCSFNTLMWRLANAGLWRYQNVRNAEEIVQTMRYLGDMQEFRQRDPERLRAAAYDAIYVDEGQDFHEEQFRLLKELCRVTDGSEANLYVFYDDAQNLFGRGRPNWQSLGLNVRGGRSFVMTRCFRNTRPIVEATFNVLYGSCAPTPDQAPTKEFGNIGALEQKNLIEKDGSFWRIRFAPREGSRPKLSISKSIGEENKLLISRLCWLIAEQEVRPEDIHVLAYSRRRAMELADAVAAARIPGVDSVHVAFSEKEKDQRLGQRGRLTLSTVASAKGYDAFCVLLASANEFPSDVIGRASFYVGCTRAIEYLEVFAYENKGLAAEMEAVLGLLK